MVLATASQDTIRHDLKSLAGGYVEAKRLTYGQKIHRKSMSTMKMVSAGKSDDFEGEMKLANEEATLYDFQHCIVEHNLEEELPVAAVSGPEGPDSPNMRKLDMSNIQDIRKLDPRVGEEIETFLNEINNYDEDEGN
jgi:hypothetical protein